MTAQHLLHRRSGRTFADTLALLVVTSAAFALLLPAIGKSDADAQGTICRDNLRKIGQGCLEYERDHNGLPPRRTGFGNGSGAYGGWGSRILPYVSPELGDKYHHDYDFFDPKNKEVVSKTIPVYVCPATPGDRKLTIRANATGNSANPNKDELFVTDCGPTDFMASNGLFMPSGGYGLNWTGGGGARRQALEDNDPNPVTTITDGTSQTLMLIERAGAPEKWRVGKRIAGGQEFNGANNSRGTWAGWGSFNYGAFRRDNGEDRAKGDADDCSVNCNNTFGIYGFHAGGAHVLFCDGSVRFVGDKLDGLTLARLTMRDDGQLISWDAF